MDTDNILAQRFISAARLAARGAYAPYSNIRFGCAVAFGDEKDIYTGANVENAAYGSTICAERVAICAAVAQRRATGKSLQLTHVAISRVDEHGDPVFGLTPCGACLQVMAEFGSLTTTILLDNLYSLGATDTRMLGDLLPAPFYIPREQA